MVCDMSTDIQEPKRDEVDEFLDTLKVHNKDLDACFNDAVAVSHLKAAIHQLIEQAEKKARIAGIYTGWGAATQQEVDDRIAEIKAEKKGVEG